MPPFPFHSLLDWYKANGRHYLPWRQYFHLSIKDIAYHIWLSEILLQQTQVERVIGYYIKILARFPTIESLAAGSYENFFSYYQWLGYYSRARNLLKTALIVSEKYGGVFPNDTAKLMELPGVGPYTATAIRAFAYNEAVLSFDTNLEKIFARYYHGNRFLKLSKAEKVRIEGDFLASGISGREINAAFMDFGSLASTNTKPSDENGWRGISADYPLDGCLWLKTRGALEIQEKKKKAVFPMKDASIVVILHENHKIYYSSDSGTYKPFILPPTEADVRHFIQEYFRENYGLELSVRPIHRKYFDDDRPFIVCNAQVQRGKTQFTEYKKENWIFVKNT